MSIAEFSIRNPVMTVMLCVLIAAAGIMSYLGLPVQESPNVTYPAITITTILPGGNAQTINQSVTKVLEKQLNTLPNLENITAHSQAGKSSVTIHFKLGTDMNISFNHVQNAVNHVSDKLPKDARPPLINTATSEGAPVIMLSLTGKQSLKTLNRFARDVIYPNLQNITGVGRVDITGAGKEAVSIKLDLNKLAALKIAPDEIQQAFKKEHVDLPGGDIKSGKKTYALNLDLSFHSIRRLGHMVVTYRKNAPILLKDIADIELGFSSKDSNAFFNSKESVGIDVIRQTDANTVGLIDQVNKKVSTVIMPKLPKGMTLQTVYSENTFILKIINSLQRDIWLAIITAGIVIFLFLRNFRSTVVIITVIPISLLGAVATIKAFGYTINSITLLSLTLLVGIVVDDSIIILENIFRKKAQEKKASHLKQVIDGTDEVTMPVTACSFTLVSIFLPIVFMGGVLSLLFKPFAIVVTAGVLISLLLSLTINPVLCGSFLTISAKETKLGMVLLRGFEALESGYKSILLFCLNRRWIALLLVLLMFGLCYPMFHLVNKEFMPVSSNTGYFTVNIQVPQGLSTAYTRARVKSAEEIIKINPNVKHIFSSTGPTANQGRISVQLKPLDKLTESQSTIMTSLKSKLEKIPGAQYFIHLPNKANNLSYEIRGTDFDKLVNQAYKLLNQINKNPALGQTYIYLAASQPQYQVFMDRVLASSLGITSSTVANILSTMSSHGVKVGHFSQSATGKRYDVFVKPQNEQFSNAEDLSYVYVKGHKDQHVRLNTIVQLEKSLIPSKLTRSNLQYSIGFDSTPQISSNKAIQLLRSIADKSLAKGYSLHMTGSTASLGNTINEVTITFLLIIGLVYIVLASQFNSFIQPLIVMLMQPLALAGGLFTLYITGQSLNVYSMIGMLMLIGLTTKNTIMLVSLANNHMREGMSSQETLMLIAPARMRPVLMTALALIMSQLPSLLDSGNTYLSLSLVIFGGITLSSLFSLVVIPSFYSYFAQIAPPRKLLQI